MAGPSEMLFVDPLVSDLEVLLGHLRPEVEAIVLDRMTSPTRQIAAALDGCKDLDAVHVVAHGAPGRVSFAAGECSAETLADAADDLAAIGDALGADGDLRLWSCHTGEGARGRAFVDALSRATGARVAAATTLVGSPALGGRWQLEAWPRRDGLRPPLTDVGLAEYAGTNGAEGASGAMPDDYIHINTNGAPVTLDTGAYSLVAKINGKTQVIGQFSVLKGFPHNILVKVSTIQSGYTVYAGPDGNLRDGQITIYDSSGNYSQRAAVALLGADGGAVAVRRIAVSASASLPQADGKNALASTSGTPR